MSSSHTIKADNFKVSTDGTTYGLEMSKEGKNSLRGDWQADSLKVEQGSDPKSPVTISHLAKSLVQFQRDCSEFWVPREEWEETSNETVKENTERIEEIEKKLKDISAREEIEEALANFYNKEEIGAALANFYNKGEIDGSLADFYSKGDVDLFLSRVVHKTGDEYIQGNKTFLNNVVVANTEGTSSLTVLPLGAKTNLGADAYGLHVSAAGGLQLFGTHFLLGDIWTNDSVKMVRGNVSLYSTDRASIGFDYANEVIFRTMPNDGREATYKLEAWQWDNDSHTTKSASAGVKLLKPSQKTALEKSSVLNMEEGDERWGTPDLSGYLTKTDAGSTYLTKTDASSTYLTKKSAETLYVGNGSIGSFSRLDKTISIAKTTPFVEKLIESVIDEDVRLSMRSEFSEAVEDFYNTLRDDMWFTVKTDCVDINPLIANAKGKSIFIDFNITYLNRASIYVRKCKFPVDFDIPVILPNLKEINSAEPVFPSTFKQPVWFPNLTRGACVTYGVFFGCSEFDHPVALLSLSTASNMFNGSGMSAKNIAYTLKSLPRHTDGYTHSIGFDCEGMANINSNETVSVSLFFSNANPYLSVGFPPHEKFKEDYIVEYSMDNCPIFINDDDNQTLRKAFVLAIGKGWTVEIPAATEAVAMLIDDEEPSEQSKWYKLEKTEYGEVKDSNGVRYTVNECSAAWSHEGLNVGYTQFPSREACLEAWELTELTSEEMFPPME